MLVNSFPYICATIAPAPKRDHCAASEKPTSPPRPPNFVRVTNHNLQTGSEWRWPQLQSSGLRSIHCYSLSARSLWLYLACQKCQNPEENDACQAAEIHTPIHAPKCISMLAVRLRTRCGVQIPRTPQFPAVVLNPPFPSPPSSVIALLLDSRSRRQ